MFAMVVVTLSHVLRWPWLLQLAFVCIDQKLSNHLPQRKPSESFFLLVFIFPCLFPFSAVRTQKTRRSSLSHGLGMTAGGGGGEGTRERSISPPCTPTRAPSRHPAVFSTPNNPYEPVPPPNTISTTKTTHELATPMAQQAWVFSLIHPFSAFHLLYHFP